MSVPAQPLKLNYAKGRQKSKSKNQLESQQKIQFDVESSTDIFAHLNQDNLNYIKKQLKHKKSGQSQEKAKPTNLINDEMRDFIKTKEQSNNLKTNDNDKKITDMTSSNSKQILKQKPHQQQDSILVESIEDNFSHDKQREKTNKSVSQKSRNSYQGLEPPPLTYTTKQKQLTENISERFQSKIKSKSLHQNETRSNVFSTQRNNFLQYELKSETSNNLIGQSNVTEEKSNSQDLSIHQKGSQFIDYLSSYIEELNGTGAKMFVRGNQSVNKKRQQVEGNLQNFRKIKQKAYGYKQIESVLSEESFQNRQDEFDKMDGLRNIRYNSMNNNGKSVPLYHSVENQSLENNQQTYNHPLSIQNEANIDELKRQLQKQKYCCTKLALELQKYKENQTRNMKEIRLLQKTIEVLKIQVENVKQLYQNQAQQTQKILAFFQMQKQKDQQTKRRERKNSDKNDRQLKMSRQKMDKQPEVNFRQPSKSFNGPFTRSGSMSVENEFQNLMKFKDLQSKYSELDPKFLSRLMDQFEKGQQSYRNEKKTARIKHPQVNNEFYCSQKNLEQHVNFDTGVKINPKKQKDSENQEKYFQNMFERSKNQRSQKKRKSKKQHSSQSSEEMQRLQSSLQKLKKQYESFKAQTTKTYRLEEKAANKKRNSLKNPISKQFSQVFVK